MLELSVLAVTVAAVAVYLRVAFYVRLVDGAAVGLVFCLLLFLAYALCTT